MNLSLYLEPSHEQHSDRPSDGTVLDLVARFAATPPDEHDDLVVTMNVYGPYLTEVDEATVVDTIREEVRGRVRAVIDEKYRLDPFGGALTVQADALLQTVFDELFRSEIVSAKGRDVL